MTKIYYHNDKKYDSFRECFEDCVVTKLDNLYEIDVTYFVDEKDIVYSLFMNVMKYGNKLYKLKNITWQEESISYGYHNVCNTYKNDGYVLYDFENDTILQDTYLDDKYNDCSDGYFSERLETMFKEYPDLLPELVDE